MVLPLLLFIFLIIIVSGGMGVDFMKYELERTRLQFTLDNAVLAAANTRNSLDPDEVVRDYFAKVGMEDFLTDVQWDGGDNWREVTASAERTVRTDFLAMLGTPNLVAPAAGKAEEALGDTEISLVLDISNSMNSNSRITRMRAAAAEFVDTVLTEDNRDKVSLSVIPYTSNVNAGYDIVSRMHVPLLHGWTYCVEFKNKDYETTAIYPEKTYRHGQFFEETSNPRSSEINNPACPKRSYEEISAFSQDRAAMKTKVQSLVGRANTAIHIGMKWAAALLDPEFRPVISSMAEAGLVDDAFGARPQDFGGNVMKTIVLMTDGVNVDTVRLTDEAYETTDMRVHWSQEPLYTTRSKVDSEYWDKMYYTRYTAEKSDELLLDVCQAAKDRNIIVWTIGFEVDNVGADVMQRCASDPSFFYRVEGIEISDAFSAIARQLNQLQLTQ